MKESLSTDLQKIGSSRFVSGESGLSVMTDVLSVRLRLAEGIDSSFKTRLQDDMVSMNKHKLLQLLKMS